MIVISLISFIKLANRSAKDNRVAHLNVCSLRNKIEELRCLQMFCSRVEVLAITETHLDKTVPDTALDIDGMKFLRLDRKGRKGGGCILYYAPFQIASIFDDPDDHLWAWQCLFNDICDEHAPWKEVKVRSSSDPWIKCDIRYKMNRRCKLFIRAAASTKCPQQWTEYKRVRNEVTSDLRKAKAAYVSKMFSEVKNTRAYWNLIMKATNP